MNLLAKLLVPREDKFLFIKRSIDANDDNVFIDLPTAILEGDSVNAIGQALDIALNDGGGGFRVKERLFWWQYRAQEGGYYFGPHNIEIWVYRGELIVKDINSLPLEKDSEYLWLSLIEAEEIGFDINLSGLISHSYDPKLFKK